ncbi:MAG: amidohydrolase family protein [Planctomycetes bacterium]|nr:amidohydrolase family protein [Planctomycetota bacterium]
MGTARTAAAALAALALASLAQALGDTVVLRAGTIHTVDGSTAITGGGAVVVKDGRIVAVGKDVEVPAGAHVVDYGPDAVLAPGLVSAGSAFGAAQGSPRTADPAVRAIDNFDTYSNAYLLDLMGGVTTAYVAPARARLVGGQGAVVQLAGEGGERVLDESAAIHGTITSAARSVPGYWEPPVPATIDVGLGLVEQQLPGSAMGAVLALDELLARAKGRVKEDGRYGPQTSEVLRELMSASTPWRMGADSAEEVRVLLEWSKREKLPLVLEGASGAAALAKDVAEAKVPVIVTVDAAADNPGRDFGKGEDARWPVYDAAAKYAAAGVELAIATDSRLRAGDLRFAAQLASRGGLSADAALRAITLGAAKAIGVDAEVGSLTVGKRGDVCVFTGAPLAATTGVVATWVGGELAWKNGESSAVVVEVEELHVGDGEVLRPGQLLLRNGRVAELGRRVSHPMGATVVRAPVAMPGMIDALGFLGLNGSSRVPQPDFKLARIVESGDETDRRVAKAGVTTVMMSPRGVNDSGVPMLAYKPAAEDVEAAIVADPAALRVQWTDQNRLKSGQRVRETLEKARDYAKKWADYEEAMKKWVPPPAEAPKEDKSADKKEADKKDADKKEGEKKDEKSAAPEEKKDESSGDKKDEKKDDKKKGKKDEEEADPVTGMWSGKLTLSGSSEAAFTLRLRLEGDKVSGALRCESVSTTLVALAGSWKHKQLAVAGLGTRGFVYLSGEPKGGKFEARIEVGGSDAKCALERTAKELPEIKAPEIRKAKAAEAAAEPKGKPRSPGIDPRLDPFRRAMRGEAAILVHVEREDEILACVAAFEAAGIQPVLVGAEDAWKIADRLRGRVAGVLLSHQVLATEEGKGLNSLRNRYVELASAGVKIAFHSAAEEGAAELPVIAAYAVSRGLSPDVALRALTVDVAAMMGVASRVGRLAAGLDGDVLLLDGPPLEPQTRVLRTFVNGEEVR